MCTYCTLVASTINHSLPLLTVFNSGHHKPPLTWKSECIQYLCTCILDGNGC